MFVATCADKIFVWVTLVRSVHPKAGSTVRTKCCGYWGSVLKYRLFYAPASEIGRLFFAALFSQLSPSGALDGESAGRSLIAMGAFVNAEAVRYGQVSHR